MLTMCWVQWKCIQTAVWRRTWAFMTRAGLLSNSNVGSGSFLSLSSFFSDGDDVSFVSLSLFLSAKSLFLSVESLTLSTESLTLSVESLTLSVESLFLSADSFVLSAAASFALLSTSFWSFSRSLSFFSSSYYHTIYIYTLQQSYIHSFIAICKVHCVEDVESEALVNNNNNNNNYNNNNLHKVNLTICDRVTSKKRCLHFCILWNSTSEMQTGNQGTVEEHYGIDLK